jgi:tRNA (guanine10-N2)-dimethyltransferase
VAELFFLLSGENETMPAAELKAILEAEGFAFEVKERLDQLVRLVADQNSVDVIHRRSALTRTCGFELFACEAEEAAIMKAANSVNFGGFLGEGESFAVRVRRVKGYSEKIRSVPLEGKLGKYILNSTTGTRVNLNKPNKTFFGVLTSGKLIFGLKLAEMQTLTFSERRPRKKPFFHPSAMPSKLARCMVNLSRAKSGELVFDPFCGTGSAMIEAAFVGCRVLGFDVQRRMAEGTRKNLRHFGVEAEGVVIADSRRLPLVGVDRVVTDPPYGKSATTLKSTTKEIVEGVLSSALDLLRMGQLICIASPKSLGISNIGEKLGYRHLESHFAYVHGTLTREIAVFEKV